MGSLTRREAIGRTMTVAASIARLPRGRWLAGSAFDPWVEVNPAHLRHNLAEVSRRVGGRPVLAVVKNAGYGLGHLNAARILEPEPAVSGFAVIKFAEAVALRDGGITKPILWMGPIDDATLREAVARDITPMVYTPIGPLLDAIAAERGRPVTIQVHVDTGLGREGVPWRQARALIDDLAARRGVVIRGVMTGFSEDPDLDREQLARFTGLLEPIRRAGVALGPRHAASSFALFGDGAGFLDQVRPGMALWGVYSEQRFRGTGAMALEPAAALRARVAYLRRLEPGDTAGYEKAFVAREPTWVATVPMGHVDGVPRAATRGGTIRIGDRAVPVVAVSASHTIVALGSEPGCQVGDLATLFDWRPGSRPEDLGAATGASVYDVMMHLDPTLPRRIIP